MARLPLVGMSVVLFSCPFAIAQNTSSTPSKDVEQLLKESQEEPEAPLSIADRPLYRAIQKTKKEINSVNRILALGASYLNPFGRKSDQAGVGVSYTDPTSSDLRDENAQLIFNPSARDDQDVEAVFGLRAPDSLLMTRRNEVFHERRQPCGNNSSSACIEARSACTSVWAGLAD